MALTHPIPRLCPGVVVHDPSFAVDDLLADFAADLSGRGFRVRGLIQRNNRGGGTGGGCAPRIEMMDLADGRVFRLDRTQQTHAPDSATTISTDFAGLSMTEAVIGRALAEDTDLVILSRFSALEGVRKRLVQGLGSGLPLLTSVAGQCLGKWHGLAGAGTSMLTPDRASLWRWWGPERLYQDLLYGVPDDEVRRITIGPRWVMVQGPHGCGLAHLPRGAGPALARLDGYRGLGLRGLARLVRSWDAVDMALGMAAINAATNRTDLDTPAGNGIDHYGTVPGPTVVVGAFPGLAERLPHAHVIETNPRPGEFPASAADYLLPGSRVAILTAAGFVSRTLPRLLSQAAGARVAVVGPATPLSPRVFAYGIETLAGFLVTDPEGMAIAVATGAKPREFRSFGRFVYRRAPAAATGAPPRGSADGGGIPPGNNGRGGNRPHRPGRQGVLPSPVG